MRGLWAPCGERGLPPGRRWSDAGVVETVAARQVPGWLLGDEEGLVRRHVKHCLERGFDFCLEHHVSRLHQDVWPRVPARYRGHPAAAEGERVVEGATAERQHPMERGVLDLFPHVLGGAEPVADRETLSADPCVSWCECVAVVRYLTKLQEACDAKANHRGRGVMNAMDVVEKKKWAVKAQKYRSRLARMTAVRDQVAVVETDSMADLVLSQGGTTVENLVRYQYKVGNFGRRYSSRGAGRAQDGHPLLATVTRVEQLVRLCRPHRGNPWTVAGFLGRVIPGVAHWGAVPDVGYAESARWLRALSVESRLLRWIACSDLGLLYDRFTEAKKPWPENSTFAHWWHTVEDRVLLCAEEVARATPPATSRATSTDSWCTGTSRRRLPRSSSSMTWRRTCGSPRRSQGALLLHRAPCLHRPTDAPFGTLGGAGRPGRGSGTWPLCHGAGVHDELMGGGGPCREGRA